MKSVLVLAGATSRTKDLNLAAMATRMGAVVQIADLSNRGSGEALASRIVSSPALAVSADSLLELSQNEQTKAAVRERMLRSGAMFVHGCAPKIHDALLAWVSAGTLRAAVALDTDEDCDVPAAGRPFTRQLAGSRFARAQSATAAVFVGPEGSSVTLPLLTVSGRPTLVSTKHVAAEADRARCSLFVATASDFPDPDQRVSAEEDVEAFYETLVPLLVFLREACGDFWWHGSSPAARLIVDDPVLRRVYGCLDFGRLFESMRHHEYAATVAYIPWNYARTQPDDAAFFLAAGRQFSLCVHGCDHTNDEYGSLNEGHLQQKSRLAMERMRRHEWRTQIPCEPIMVFPQGRFSTAGLRGLRSSGFLAAINSTRVPVDSHVAPLSLWDLLQPANSRPDGFPVFCRHYVEPTFPLLFDLFLGRPAFIVEHHDFFRSGFPSMEALADRLNATAPAPAWMSLVEAVERACWKRAVSDNEWEVRFYTDRFVMTNDSDRPLRYRLLKEEPDSRAVTGVTVNGTAARTERIGGQIALVADLNPGETANVRLQLAAPSEPAFVPEGKVYATRVLIRRALSEFRDEYLVKHPVMLASAKRIVRVLKASSDSLPRPGAARATSR
jgi:hypothetical protein